MGAIEQTTQQYAENTTIHGIGYIFGSSGISVLERLLWILIVGLGIFGAIFLSVTAYQNWQETPVLTTVATTGHPIEKVQFPAITICAQGSVRAIVDAALVQQFKAYLKAKDLNYDDLDKASKEDESQKFLNEKYPGSKQPPNQMIELMTSPSAQKALQAQSIANPEETKNCQIAKRRKKRATSCPDSTWRMTGFGCFKFFDTPQSRSNAYNKCQSLDSQAILPILKSDLEFQSFFEDLKNGIFPDFNLQTSTFWIQASKDPTQNYFTYDDGSLATNVNYLDITTPIGTGPCATAQLLTVSPPKFSLDAELCETKAEFFCVIHDNIIVTTTTPAPSTPTAPVNATPTLPEFPCIQNSLRKKRNTENTENQSIEKLDLMLNPQMKNEREAKIQSARQNYDDSFGNLDLEKSYDNLFEILWYSQLPCFDVQNVTSNVPHQMSVIKNCAWKGLDINCSAIFKTLPTDRGMCCTFNMERAEMIFKESKYSQMVQKMQDTDATNSFFSHEAPEWYKNRKEPTSRAGQKKGLKLILDAHADQVSSGTIFDNFKGFVTLVGGRDSFPLTGRQSFLLKPGQESYVAITATSVISDEAVRDIEPEKRNCFFHDEHPLKLHRNYSQANCVFQCQTDYARSQMGSKCIPWYLPALNEHLKMCDPWETQNFTKHFETVPDDHCYHCLPDCISTIYDTEVSSAPFFNCDHTNIGSSSMCQFTLDSKDQINPPLFIEQAMEQYKKDTENVPDFLDQSGFFSNQRRFIDPKKIPNLVLRSQVEESPTYNAYERDIALVHFYFDKSSILQFTRQKRMTIVDYISQMGGLLGLFIGFSFISGAELIYWLTFRLAKNVKMNKRIDSGNAK